jgi:nucleoside-diphosphate-sugar epimerase
VRILLTGHKGYIGAVTGSILVAKGHEVVGVDSDLFELCDFGEAVPELSEFQKDIRDLSETELTGFDAVVHLAALSNDVLGNLNPDLTYDINYRASVKLAKLAKAAGVTRFVFSSSCSTYGAGDDGCLDETAALNPITAYAKSKILAEQDIMRMADDDFSPTYLRNATAYGVSPRLRLDIVLNDFVASAYTTGTVYIKSDGTPWRPIVHIRDISLAILSVLEAPQNLIHNEVFNVGQFDENFRVSELAEIVAETVPGCRIEYAPDGGPDKRSYRISCDKIRRTLPAFQPKWNARAGAKELHDAFCNAGLSSEDVQSGRYIRIRRLQHLMRTGSLDSSLRRSDVRANVNAVVS